MSVDEESSKVSEPLKVGATVFVKLTNQVVQVGNTIFNDPDSLSIESLRAIEKINDAPADHGIQGH